MKNGKSKILNLIIKLLIVFIGVFAAFLLNDYRNDKSESNEIRKSYKLISEDLDWYIKAGTENNRDGFINLFQNFHDETILLKEKKELPIGFGLLGDYWNIELINSMLISGKLNNIDPEIFKEVSRFHTVHQNMINQIDKYNLYYDEQVVPNLDKGVNEFYVWNTNEFKIKYKRLLTYQSTILGLSKSTVEFAEELKIEIESKYL